MPMTANVVLKGWQEKNGLWNWTFGASISEIPVDQPLTEAQKSELEARMDEAMNVMRSFLVKKHDEYRSQEFEAMHGGEYR